jgi:hypothetical protein
MRRVTTAMIVAAMVFPIRNPINVDLPLLLARIRSSLR